jgi:hypothetical protein
MIAADNTPIIKDKKWGRGVPSDRCAAMAERAQTMEEVADALRCGDMTAREAQKARYDIALKVKSSYHPPGVRTLMRTGVGNGFIQARKVRPSSKKSD